MNASESKNQKKLEENQKNQRNQKNQSPGGNPWAQHFSQDFGFFGFFGFFWFSSSFFAFFFQPCSRWKLPSLKTKKIRGKPKKPKKPKKPIPWRKPLGTTFLPRFWFLWFFWFSSSFLFLSQPCSRWKLPSLKTKKPGEMQKKTQKIPWVSSSFSFFLSPVAAVSFGV